jgi:two-component system response regulator NreC
VVGQDIRVLVVDPSEVVRIGLRTALTAHLQINTIIEARSMAQAAQAAGQAAPSLVIVEPAHLLSAECDVLCSIMEYAALGGIAFSNIEDWQVVTYWLDRGCKGYVPKRSPASDILNAVTKVMRGKVYVSPLLSPEHMPPAYTPLSPRESEILALVAVGYTSVQIADKLCISRRTVENHREHIKRKICAHSRADLVKYAMEHDLLDS